MQTSKLDVLFTKAIEKFCSKKSFYPLDERIVLRWLSEQGATDISIAEFNSLIENIADYFYKNCLEVLNNQTYTVGQLKKVIQDLPHDMPVLYQRVEDSYFNKHSWNCVKGLWEERAINQKEKDYYEQNPDNNMVIVTERDNIRLLEYSEYIAPFNARITIAENGEQIFVIEAHY